MIRSRACRALRAVAAASLFALLAACSAFAPGVSVTRTEGQNVPRAQGDDPEEDAIGAREHPRIVASYGGIYADRQA
ncbi:MAG: metalloprotease, partial [Devosia sp.]